VPDARRAIRLSLVTHNESISIADYFTVRDGQRVVPPDLPLRLSPRQRRGAVVARDLFGATGKMQPKWHILDENEIEDGIDELGVLSTAMRERLLVRPQLSIEETRAIAPYQNATGHVGVVGGARRHGVGLENPTRGIVEADEMDFHRRLGNPAALSRPGEGFLYRLTPLTDRPDCSRRISTPDPRQFRNVLVRERGLAEVIFCCHTRA
jgi:homospermidine synthase